MVQDSPMTDCSERRSNLVNPARPPQGSAQGRGPQTDPNTLVVLVSCNWSLDAFGDGKDGFADRLGTATAKQGSGGFKSDSYVASPLAEILS